MARVWVVADEGLGNSSYVAEVADGLALVLDPGRDPRPYLDLAAAHGLRVAFAAETHVHADFVSGGRELAGLGARLLAPARSGLAFGHEEMRDGQELDLGGLTLRAVATPGHTPEHLSYLLLDGTEAAAVFTGGALIAGGVARTDLGGPASAVRATRAAYRSARVLLSLPDSLAVFPTHGPGSFCSPGTGGEHTTTIGREKATNPLLAGADEDTFTASLLAGLGSYPAYFDWMPAINRRGAPRTGTARPVLAGLTAPHVAELAAAGATIVDARPIEAFAAAHVPGSLSNALRPAFATWLGWLADPQRPLVVVLDAGQDRDELVEACLKVGYDDLAGELDGGITAWQAAGLATASIPLIEASEVVAADGRQVIDVRQASEWAAGHIPGAAHRELGALAGPRATAGLAGAPAIVMCEHGQRGMTGASLLAAASGAAGLSVLRGGPGDWAKAAGESLEHE
jgi:glyoxylase-like metal-dependent hydrolase (beta-lactamase superfamily II)/rhodanese-related sulfurtransferase